MVGGFSGVPPFVLVGSVSIVSWPFFAGSLHVVVSLSRWLLLPRSVPCVAWAHLACQKLRSKWQFRELLSWHLRMHQVTHLLRRRGGYPEGFFLIWRMLLKFELQVRSSSERLRRGHYMSESSYERLSKVTMSTCDRLTSASNARLRSSSDRLPTRMGSKTVCA